MPSKKPLPPAGRSAPIAASAPMTASERQAKVKAELERTGGRKLPAINLPADANVNLQALLDAGHPTIKAAVVHSLALAARHLR